ncbi:uncharacterized protein LOC110886308 [Helianthus annuus]|uniref:uncharacterized protein LOC110886308 n=1 Tax=Helianthus annuus TaxID=4232 RepID=UPI000B8F7DA2|nr:uncharacterized protein LOC110886308 [Helianthus annuus]
MLCLLDCHDMLMFINGSLKEPREHDGSKAIADETAFRAMYRQLERVTFTFTSVHQDKRTLIVEIGEDEKTALYIAISNPSNISFLENLLNHIYVDEESLSLSPLSTALWFAIECGNKVAVELLVNKNPHLLFIDYQRNYSKLALPLETAALYSQRAILDYLFEMYKQYIGLTDNFGYPNPFKGNHVYNLFTWTITKYFDVAYDLLKDHYHELAVNQDRPWYMVKKLAEMPGAYQSAKPCNFYQRFVYFRLFLHLLLIHCSHIQSCFYKTMCRHLISFFFNLYKNEI